MVSPPPTDPPADPSAPADQRAVTAPAPTVLQALVVDIEQHVARSGWDQPPVLFALVETADLIRREPALAQSMGLAAQPSPPGSLTPVEQESLGDDPVDVTLSGIVWPEEVLGCALVHEVLVLPPSAEQTAPVAEVDALRWAANHPDRRDVRMVVGVLRDGSRASALRVRARSGDPAVIDDVLVAPDLAPNLADKLMDTLR